MTGLNIKYSNRKFGFTLTEELGKLKKHIICKAVLAKKKNVLLYYIVTTVYAILHFVVEKARQILLCSREKRPRLIYYSVV